ncbi:hypothetical protein [Methanobacterium petrolearium]|uniref:hypothetical protein n=1 Tax=Methanobacterium petrolearium TaxID=710190 RepID=UPI001AE750DB|nr:hypothetical protein [Methanobacterium petrolearium]MBP1944819.1 hypothetical protein [Methanobacterium petrolearium]BDZ70102.1 hypothetical protein GCM10025861_06190 [Methanobacterium petrolearium]
MSRAIKIILFLVFFFIFFEAGLFASYTIVTQQPPNPNDLIEMQLNGISSLLNLNTPKIATQNNLKIVNKNEVARALEAKTGVDGINLETLSAQSYQNVDDENITVNITAVGYKDSQSGTSSNTSTIVIKSNETYSITATALASPATNGVKINVATIVITSSRIIYNKQ